MPAPDGEANTDHGAATGLDHIGIVARDLDAAADAFRRLGFALTPTARHAGGRTRNRCAMLRDGGYLELMATVPGQTSATLDRFLRLGSGAHTLALEVESEAAALARLTRAGIAAGPVAIVERAEGPPARVALLLPPDQPEARVLLIRHLTRDLLWSADNTVHPNRAVALIEAVLAVDTPAETMTRLCRLAGRAAEPDPMGGYRIALPRGAVRVLTPAAAGRLFPGAAMTPPLTGLTLLTDDGNAAIGAIGRALGVALVETPCGPVAHAGGVAIRFAAKAA